MPAPRKYPQELRERAVRLEQAARQEDPELSVTAAVTRVGSKIGVNPDTLRGWVKQVDIDAGKRPGTTTEDAKRIKELERENRELSGPTRSCWRPRVMWVMSVKRGFDRGVRGGWCRPRRGGFGLWRRRRRVGLAGWGGVRWW